MSKTASVPSYRLHKQSGQAVVTLPDGLGGRREVLLGKHGTVESRLDYARVITEWEAAGRRLPQPAAVVADLSVNEMLPAYVAFAESYYLKNGEPTSQLDRVRLSIKPVRETSRVVTALPLKSTKISDRRIKASKYSTPSLPCAQHVPGHEQVPYSSILPAKAGTN